MKTPSTPMLFGFATHGAQQLSLFNGYYDTFCFQPLVILEGTSGKLITAILRPGKRPTGQEISAILKTSCHAFYANTFRLFLHSFAYSLLHAFRGSLLAGTDFANALFDTIFLRFLKIGAAVREWKTRIQFRLPQSYPLKDLFARMYDRLALLM